MGEFPFLALLGYTGEDDKVNLLCGGSIINQWYVLSAASCGNPSNTPDYVRLGEWKLEDDPKYKTVFPREYLRPQPQSVNHKVLLIADHL